MTKFMKFVWSCACSNPLTFMVMANTGVALLSPHWPPIQADKGVTIVFPLMLWIAYIVVEWVD